MVRRLVVPAVVVLWSAAVLAGTVMLARYKETPGASAGAPANWPAASRVPRIPGKAMLVMMAHPKCPCTQASLSELERLLAREPGLAAVLVLVRPADAPEGWERGGLLDRAREIGVPVVLDAGGAEAHRFGALTSGQSIVYDAAGRLLFSGGVTAARGHEGDNAGVARIRLALREPPSRPLGAPVFGCALEHEDLEKSQ